MSQVINHGQILNALKIILSSKGKTIQEISSQSKRELLGDATNYSHQDKTVWWTKRDIDYAVAKMLNIHPSLYGPDKTLPDFITAITKQLIRLRKKGTVVDWNTKKRFNIYRLAKPIDIPNMKKEFGIDKFPEIKRYNKDDPDGMKETFIAILTNGKKDNTYKFTLAKTILDYCIETVHDGTDKTYEIPYEYLARKFFEYYWYQKYKFRMKQDFHETKTPMVMSTLSEVFGEESTGDIKLLKEDKVKKAKELIQKRVFGHAKNKTSMVIPKFQNVTVPNGVERRKTFYDWSDSEQKITLNPEAYWFFRNNNQLLSRAVLAEWAKFLERVNYSMPKLVAKIDDPRADRGSLVSYRKMYLPFSKECFYCKTGLKSGCIHVDHFIPWSYVFEDSAWNLVLACQRCNCEKSNALATCSFLDKLIIRNEELLDSKIHIKPKKVLQESLKQFNTGKKWQTEIENHYKNCKDYGFNVIKIINKT